MYFLMTYLVKRLMFKGQSHNPQACDKDFHESTYIFWPIFV